MTARRSGRLRLDRTTRPVRRARAMRPARAMRAWLAAVAVVLALVLAGCTSNPGSNEPTSPPTTAPTGGGDPPQPVLRVGSNELALTWGGQIRMFRVYRPARLTPLAPLVVMLHGGLGNSRATEAAYGWDALADQEGFVVAYPEGVGGNWNVGGGCCGVSGQSGVDDVGFVRAVVDQVRSMASLDPHRTYAAGVSSGGMLAYRLACDTTAFAAIGAVAATQLGPCVNPSPTSVIHVHGTADPTVPYAGAPGLGIAEIIGPPIPALHTTWREVGRCGGDVIRSEGAITYATAQCPSDRTVSLVTIEGGGHAWPGVAERGPLDASPSAAPVPTSPLTPTVTVGPTMPVTPPYPTTARLWEFFKPHSR